MPDLDVALNNAAGWANLGWNPPLFDNNCQDCDVLASDDFNFIGSLAGHQYYYSTISMTFAEAVQYAETLETTIAILEDSKEVPMITYETPESRYFIGLIDEDGDGEFEWIDGTEFNASEFGVLFENETDQPAVVVLNQDREWEVVSMDDFEANFVFENVCIEMEIVIEQNDEDDNDALIEPGTTAEVTYVAENACGEVATCGFNIEFVENEVVAYCEPTGIATDEDNPYYLDALTLGDYTNESGDDDGYGDYSSQEMFFNSGDVLTLQTLFAGPDVEDVPMYVSIWLDMNEDGDFYDENETLYQGVGIEGLTDEITLPNAYQAIEGTKLRIAVSRLTFAESCGDFLNGEVEDYTVSIFPTQDSQTIGNTFTTNSLGADMFLYPNPVAGELKVTLKNIEAEVATLRIYNSVGQVVAIQKVATNQTVKVDVSSYTDGLYSISAEANGTVQLTQKFVKK